MFFFKKNFLIFLFLSLIFSLNTNAGGMWGKGDLKLSKSTMEFLMMYMYGAGNTKYSADKKNKNKPDIFVVAIDGIVLFTIIALILAVWILTNLWQ